MRKSLALRALLLTLLMAMMVLPIMAQAPESSISNIYNKTAPFPDDVCYRKDGTPMLTVDYNYNLSLTYTKTNGDIVAIRYALGLGGDYYIENKLILVAGNTKPECYH